MAGNRNRPPRGELAGLLQPDGSFVVPPAYASEALRLLRFAIVERARESGVLLSPAGRWLLDGLYAAAEHHRRAMEAPLAEIDQDQASAQLMALTVREAADRMGCSTRWIRALLATGRLAGRRSGGTWIVHMPPLPNPEAPHRTA